MKSNIPYLDFFSDINSHAKSDVRLFWIHGFDESSNIHARLALKDSLAEVEWDLIYGKEITNDWIDQNLAALTLFMDEKPVAILDAMDIKQAVWDYLLESIDKSPKKIYMFSSGREDNKRTKVFQHNEGIHFLSLKAPAFWDFDKLAYSLFKNAGLSISSETAAFLIMRLGQDFFEIQNALRICQLNYPKHKELSFQEVEVLFTSSRFLDKFRLASLLSQKKMSLFFEEVISADVDFEEFKLFFSFMISHCVKIIDPGYTKHKEKISGYDREIIQAHKVWNFRQLDFMIEHFSSLLIKVKQKRDISLELRELFAIFKKREV